MKLRIVQIEVEAESPANAAEMIRAASGGQIRESIPEALPQLPEPKNGHHPRRAISAPKVQKRSAPGGGDTLATRVFEAIQKKPMSSMELCQALKLEPKQAYQAAHVLVKKGLAVSRNDTDGDGTRRYFAK